MFLMNSINNAPVMKIRICSFIEDCEYKGVISEPFKTAAVSVPEN